MVGTYLITALLPAFYTTTPPLVAEDAGCPLSLPGCKACFPSVLLPRLGDLLLDRRSRCPTSCGAWFVSAARLMPEIPWYEPAMDAPWIQCSAIQGKYITYVQPYGATSRFFRSLSSPLHAKPVRSNSTTVHTVYGIGTTIRPSGHIPAGCGPYTRRLLCALYPSIAL